MNGERVPHDVFTWGDTSGINSMRVTALNSGYALVTVGHGPTKITVRLGGDALIGLAAALNTLTDSGGSES